MKKYLHKLHYRSWHRGTKESDLLLGKFFDKYGKKLNQKQLRLYDYFLSITNDNDLLLFVKGEKKWPNEVPPEIIDLLEEYILSEAFRK